MGEKIWIRISQIQDGGGVTILRKFFSKFHIFLNDGFPKDFKGWDGRSRFIQLQIGVFLLF